jgi:flavin reductase (DIM6/NTAB) family NADH-FMN oxidoreductase RutF
MTLDPKTFRQTLGQFATGVTVIVTEVEGQTHGMTANAVSSLSLDPMLVLFCVVKKTRMAELMQKATGFSINILREDQQALSTYFAGGWQEPTPPPFRFVPSEGGPRLEGCLAALGCARDQILEGGDHWIVVGRAVSLHQGIEPRRPLLFYGGKYQKMDPTESKPAPDLSTVETPVQIFYDPWEKL